MPGVNDLYPRLETSVVNGHDLVARKRKDYSVDRKKLLDAIGKDAYNGVDLFEGTTPISAAPEAKAGSVDLGAPDDSGVDISNLIGGATKMWDLMK